MPRNSMYKIEFPYRNYVVTATCTDVNSYEASELKIKLDDVDDLSYDELTDDDMEYLKDLATEKLYEEKFHKEL